MTLWRLEWLRLARTRRLLAMVVVYLFFGLVGPITVRYLSAILARAGTSGLKIEVPPPKPADAIAQFTGNASQICLVVVVLIAASGLGFDARREMAIFLRTRVDSVARIVVPVYVVSTAAAISGFVIGTLGAWYETAVLIGGPPVGGMLAGLAYGALFLVFAIALVAAVASIVRGTLATGGLSLVILVALAVLSGIGSLGHWIPTGLAGAMASLVRDAHTTDYLPAAAIAVAASGLLIWFAIANGSHREI